MWDTGTPQVIEELEELMQSSPDPEADPEGDEDEEEEEEDEEEDAEANAEGDSGSRGMEPIVLHELHTFSPTFNNNCSHEGTGSRNQAQPFLGAVLTKLDIRRWLSAKNEPSEIFLVAW